MPAAPGQVRRARRSAYLPPASEPLRSYPVKIEAGRVYLQIE
jgi:nitrite reductase/ring-hydroxylating ferredoxin subunit